MLTLTIIAVILAAMFLAACHRDKPRGDGETPRITHKIINDRISGEAPHASGKAGVRVRFLMRPSTGDRELVSSILRRDFGFPASEAEMSAAEERLEMTVTRTPEDIIGILTRLWSAGADAAVTYPQTTNPKQDDQYGAKQ